MKAHHHGLGMHSLSKVTPIGVRAVDRGNISLLGDAFNWTNVSMKNTITRTLDIEQEKSGGACVCRASLVWHGTAHTVRRNLSCIGSSRSGISRCVW